MDKTRPITELLVGLTELGGVTPVAGSWGLAGRMPEIRPVWLSQCQSGRPSNTCREAHTWFEIDRFPGLDGWRDSVTARLCPGRLDGSDGSVSLWVLKHHNMES